MVTGVTHVPADRSRVGLCLFNAAYYDPRKGPMRMRGKGSPKGNSLDTLQDQIQSLRA